MKMTAPVGNGVGTQKFSIKPGPGGGLQLSGTAQTPLAAAAAAEAVETPIETPSLPPRPIAPATPFSRLYPGVDPSQVEMALDDKTGKIRFKPIEAPADTVPETPQTPVAPVAPVAPSEPDTVAQLRAELAQQNQLMTTMLQSMMTGRPLTEILTGQPAAPPEPDYSQFDLDDEQSRVALFRQMKADAVAAAKAEAQAQYNAVRPSIQDTQRQGERLAVQIAHGNDPDYAQIAAKVDQYIGNNPNISYRDTYKLIADAQIRPISKPTGPTLTPAQAEAKAAQAARYQSTSGGRATGGPSMPPGLKTFKQQAAWTAQQLALGYTEAEILGANRG